MRMLLPLSNVKVKLMLNYSTVNISFKTCIEIELANIYLQFIYHTQPDENEIDGKCNNIVLNNTS